MPENPFSISTDIGATQGSTPATVPKDFNITNARSALEGIGIADIARRNPLLQTIANIQGGATIGQELKKIVTGQTSFQVSKNVKIAEERNTNYKTLLEQGKTPEEASHIAKFSLTPTEIDDVTNVVLGFAIPEGQIGKSIGKKVAGAVEKKIAGAVEKEGARAIEKKISKVLADNRLPTSSEIGIAENFVNQLDQLPSIENTQNVKDVAASMTELSPKGGLKAFSKELKDQFVDWVNNRAATKVEALGIKNKFVELDDLGLKGIAQVQTGQNAEKFVELRKYFDTKYNQLKSAGIDIAYKTNYLPQLWANDTIDVARVFGKRLTLRPSFTFDSLLKDYNEGLKAGLTPKFKTISELAAWYEGKANKFMADKNFFDYLAKDNFIAPSGEAPLGWKTLDPDLFPKVKTLFGDRQYTGTYSAPPNLAEVINNYLSSPEGTLADFAKFSSIAKNIILSAGIPKTGVNAHGLNILLRNTLATKNPISGFLKGTYYLLNPEAASRFVQSNLDNAAFAVKHGLTLSTEEHAMKDIVDKTVVQKGFEKLLDIQRVLFEDPLFTKVMPALKLQHFFTIFKDLAQDYPEREAGQIASKITNNIFGGINYDAIARNKEVQNIWRSIILAPDWAEAQIKTGIGVVKSFNPLGNSEGAKQYRVVARNLIISYIAADVLNKAISGHSMWENAPGHTFEIEMGKTAEGQIRYLRPFGTAADFIRIPYDVALSISKGDFSSIGRVIRNRLSPTAQGIAGLVTNVDYLGRPILGKDKYGRPIPTMQQLSGLLGLIPAVPTQARAVLDLVTGRSGVEQAAVQALEFPFRYKGQPKTTSNPFSL